MKINTLTYFIANAFRSLKRNKTISIASVITVFITFIVLGSFILIAQNANLVIAGVEDKIEIKVFLDDDISLNDQKEIQVTLAEQDGVSDVSYMSKEDAYNDFKASVDEDNGMLSGYTLDNNPLPASFVVKIDDATQIENITSAVENMNGVEEVKNEQDTIDTITRIVRLVRLFGTIIFVVLVAVSAFLIMNTTRLTVYSRRREVGIMKFVGATDWFIRWPFIIEGIVIGLIGSILSIIAISLAYNYVSTWISGQMLMANIVRTSYVYTTMLFEFVIGGIVIGAISSYVALRKFLKV